MVRLSLWRLRHFCVFLNLFLIVLCRSVSAGPLYKSDPLVLYGKTISFEIFRDGKKVGRHKVNFSRDLYGVLTVSVEFDISINLLSIPIYRFGYRSRSSWKNGQLITIRADIDDNGETFFVNAVSSNRGVRISSPSGIRTWNEHLFPTNHWNAGVLSQKQVLNTLNGEISSITIAAEGLEKVRAEGKVIDAMRYEYSGDIDTTVWYDDQSRWVKMQFVAKDGSLIEYNCKRCGQNANHKVSVN